MFSRKRQSSNEIPQLSQRRAWNNHIGSVLADRTLWQFAALLSLVATCATVGTLTHLTLRSSFVPYVVEVDSLGSVRAVQPAELSDQVHSEIVRRQVSDFVSYARRVTADRVLQAEHINAAFTMVADGSVASGKLRQNYDGPRYPFDRAQKETVTVKLRSILHHAGDSWQVDWEETAYSREGGNVISGPTHFRGIVNVKIQPPTNTTKEEAFRSNPFGIYIMDFEWSQIE